jgi:acetate kinase
MRVLSLNSGSSSLKYAVFDATASGENVLLRGGVDRLARSDDEHAQAARGAFERLDAQGLTPDAVGHRIVHGGADRAAPARIDAKLLAALDELIPFAPLHLPAEIRTIQSVRERWPNLPQVACFDTAFHCTLSEAARRYALPEKWSAAGLRKYGFHGLSYEYVVSVIGVPALGRAVIAHLGSGSSMAAVSEGRSIDTTMGFTPAGGLVMGTRPGDVDPGLLVFMATHGVDASTLDDIVNRQSGLLGLSGTTADVRDLLARRSSDPRARLALEVFVWSARKWVGAMAAALGGIDSLVFTGGVGEHAAAIRAEIALGVGHLGVAIDTARNERGDAVVSPDGARCVVRVVSTDEERMVARHTRRVLEVNVAGE